MNTLTMTFLTAEGKKWNLRLPKVRVDILDEEVEALMSMIISKNVLFEGEKELVAIESASVNREEELIA